MSINNRYDFVMFFDVENGNPNGDPDAGNTPRIDEETGYGYITDVCIKRKIRNYVDLIKNGIPNFNILIKPDKALNTKFAEAYEAAEIKKSKEKIDDKNLVIVRDWMCKNYYDVRMFGAVMSTGDCPCGIVRGPVQINFARSLSPINIKDITITRQAKTTEDRKKEGETEMGKKSVIPYAVYRCEGYISAALANKTTNIDESDIELLWEAICNMFENDHSAARGKMCMRKLFVFKHDSELGNSPSHILFDKIKVSNTCDDVPRRFDDYEISIDNDLPKGVTLIEKL